MYGGVIKIRCSKDHISFIEENEVGKNEIVWKVDTGIKFNFNLKTQKEKLEELRKSKYAYEKIKNTINEKLSDLQEEIEYYQKSESSEGYYSFDFFKINHKISNILDKSNKIMFYLRNNHPLKSVFHFSKLGCTFIKFYISPRN